MRKILLLVSLISAMYCCPVYGQDEIYEDAAVAAEQFEVELPNVTDTATKYCNANSVNIRKEPNTDSEILGQSLLNTSFETVLDIGGWTMITTEDGYAYMKSDYLSDTPIKETTYSDEDLKVLAMILCGECQGYPDEEQRYVGSVFLNRVKSNQFPNTFLGVAEDRRWGIQYACWYDGNAFREVTERNLENAKWLLENGSVLPDYVLYQSGSKIGKVYLKTDYHYYGY